MIERFREVEDAYIQNFSRKDDRGDYAVFWDERLPDMYAFNCTLVKNRPEGPWDLVMHRLTEARLNQQDFLQLILDPTIEVSGLLAERFASLGFKVQPYLYMELVGRDLSGFRGNEDCTVVRATSEETLADGERLDVETSIRAGAPSGFATRKSIRKREVFCEPSKQLFSYLCYHQGRAIGKCELYLKDGYAKIEDFDVLERYQRRGFGTAVLNKIITDALESGAEHIYLIAAKDDTPKDMYRKLGFAVIGEETQLFWGK